MLGETCELYFTHLDPEPAQLALHSYFNIGDIESGSARLANSLF